MPDMRSGACARGAARLATCLAAGAVAGLVCVLAASAQQPPPQPPPLQQPMSPPVAPLQPPAAQPLPPAETPLPARREGFLDALARWMDKSAADFKAQLDESNAKWRELSDKNEKAAKDAANASKEAFEALKSLPNVRMVEGRRICELAPNGSPDCQAAAEAVCRSKGFATGKSADIETSRKCSARALLAREGNACKTETVVVKAACQ
jgi:hypothetical protein